MREYQLLRTWVRRQWTPLSSLLWLCPIETYKRQTPLVLWTHLHISCIWLCCESLCRGRIKLAERQVLTLCLFGRKLPPQVFKRNLLFFIPNFNVRHCLLPHYFANGYVLIFHSCHSDRWEVAPQCLFLLCVCFLIWVCFSIFF